MTLELAKQAGEMLIEAKRLAGHGNWLSWLEANCRVSASMAEKYMKIAKGWHVLTAENPEHVPNLSIRDAVKLLAKPRPAVRRSQVLLLSGSMSASNATGRVKSISGPIGQGRLFKPRWIMAGKLASHYTLGST